MGDSDLNRVWIELREVYTSYASDSMEVLSAVIIIAQSDMKHLIKINLQQLFYESGHGGSIGQEALVFKDSYFLKKTSFCWKTSIFKVATTFQNFRELWTCLTILIIPSQPLFMFRCCTSVESSHKQKRSLLK